ncbi:uncharacterized protein Z519_05804 [Cladophialophora bantiana CBS 173.52]|uniref:C2H2-type domain-containing protein n=1 Tax=Cladophialophora bantiana (strain ATCC 10958 / CBS 173.52 / CDC B-1940 / NIH 8579) TaxID=1442370 RepID=A0A0D2I8T1_CLAB1|nr:uncharacterized protein Z519_05804 [Cladophialophora bantiana CBS 173.52]KIW93199.1 hypothetical protein Z519_05804 [Cladophialophora bantiana CBS 173.52]
MAQSRKPSITPTGRSGLQELSAYADVLNRLPSYRSLSQKSDDSDAQVSSLSEAPSLAFSDSSSADSFADEYLHVVRPKMFLPGLSKAEAETYDQQSTGREQDVIHVGAQPVSNQPLLQALCDANPTTNLLFPTPTRADHDRCSVAVTGVRSGSRVQESTTSLAGSTTIKYLQPPTLKPPRIQVSDTSPPWNGVSVVAGGSPAPLIISNEECRGSQQACVRLNVPNLSDNLKQRAKGFGTSSIQTCWPVPPCDDDQVTCDGDDEAILDTEMNMVDELEAFFGPENARSVVGAIASSPPDAAFEGTFSNLEGLRQHAAGSGNAPASSSPQSTQPSSSPATTRSRSSGGSKRTAPTSDEAEEDGNNDGDERPKEPKRPRTRGKQIRWDCPLCRRPIGDMGTNPGCAKDGLEFRHLWEHFRKHHYGCETCGLKLSGRRADAVHLNQRQKDPSACTPGLYTGSSFEIGIDLYEEMDKIYNNPSLRPPQKWAEWWKLFFPGYTDVPDGIHQGTISFPSAEIPALQVAFGTRWDDEALKGNVPFLDARQKQKAQKILDESIRTFNYTHQPRFRTSGQLPDLFSSMQALVGVEENPFLDGFDMGISPLQTQNQPYQNYGTPGF